MGNEKQEDGAKAVVKQFCIGFADGLWVGPVAAGWAVLVAFLPALIIGVGVAAALEQDPFQTVGLGVFGLAGALFACKTPAAMSRWYQGAGYFGASMGAIPGGSLLLDFVLRVAFCSPFQP